jgi:hypothetical protein
MPDQAPSFSRGTTFYAGQTPPTVASGNQVSGVEGMIFTFPEGDPSNKTVRPSGGQVTYLAVRNSSLITLAPKRLVTWESGQEGKAVDGYCRDSPEPIAGVVDDYFPAAGGIPTQDIGLIAVKGRHLVTGASESTSGALVINVGTYLVGQTAVTSGAVSAGRARAIVVGGATTALAGNILNVIGRALTARTASNTESDILCNLRLF